MIAGCRGSAECRICAAVLRLLFAPSLARNLYITATERRIECAYRKLDVSRWNSSYPFAGDIVVKLRGCPFAGCVVEHTLFSHWCEGNHGINSERLPRLKAVFQLLGK